MPSVTQCHEIPLQGSLQERVSSRLRIVSRLACRISFLLLWSVALQILLCPCIRLPGAATGALVDFAELENVRCVILKDLPGKKGERQCFSVTLLSH